MTHDDPDNTTIVLFDDDADRIKTWREKLESVPGLRERATIFAPEPEQFAQVFEALKERQFRARGEAVTGDDNAKILDDADIVIVDFDLTPARGRSQSMAPEALRTLKGSFGDTFAYLTRCYTHAGYTVVVNQTFYQSTFDLTMREFEFSYADLNITHSDLSNEGLWFGARARGSFRPWHWPRLLDGGAFIQSLADRIELGAPLLETLGLDDPDVYDLFDPQQLEVIGRADRNSDPRTATFKSLTDADSPFGLLSQSEEPDEAALKKIAATALTHWLERVVIPAQNILVDAPHLAQRRPHLVRGDSTPERLDRLADLSPDARMDDVLDLDALAVAATKASDWTMRPVWLWPRCPRGPIPEDQIVFCEDGSFFVPIDEAQEFRSELPGPFKARFVAEIDTQGGFPVDYRPDSRFYG